MTPIDFNGLDTAVHGPIRLGTMTALRIDKELDFTTLKKRLQVTDGSLGIHLHKLEEINYIRSNKTFVKRRPKTTYRLTAKGKKALAKYLESMQQLLDAVGRATLEFRGHHESAGQSRQRVADARAAQERNSDPS